MNEERRKILEMLSRGKINVEEAEKLLSALSNSDSGTPRTDESGNGSARPKYLRVLVEPAPGNSEADRVNIRVPLKLIRAGLKMTSLIPKQAHEKVNEALREKGLEMDFAQIKPEDLEEIVSQLNDLSVEVEGKETVRVFCE
jgi:uncharacterized protein YpuA (DUF1002 family)